jgi:phosphohistidine phosphatase
MKTLYLLRHAEAEAGHGMSDSDHGRLLSARGRIEARAVGDFLKTQGCLPDFILASDALRTLSTARQVIEVLFGNEKSPVPAKYDRRLYLAPQDALMTDIQAVGNDKLQLLVVGHNPGIAELGTWLAGSHADKLEGFAPATLAVYQSTAEDWALVSPANTKLTNFFTPNID